MASNPTRRKIIQSAAGVSAIGLAGCTGDDADDGDDPSDDTPSDDADDGDGQSDGGGSEAEVVWTTSDSGSVTYTSVQGMAAVVNENSDRIFMEARPGEGTGANVGRLNRGEADVAFADNWVAHHITEGLEPYHDLDFAANQVMHMMDAEWLFTTPHDDIRSMDDIGPDTRLSIALPGSASRPYLEQAVHHVTEEYEVVDIGFTDLAGPMQEGRVDVGALPVLNGSVEGAYVDEMKSVLDELYVVDWPDDASQALQDDQSINAHTVDMSAFEGYTDAPDEVMSPVIAYRFIAPNDLEYDSVYETLEILYENREELADYHALMNFFADPEYWLASSYDNMPYHPAAADFYDEVGIWQDDLIRGED